VIVLEAAEKVLAESGQPLSPKDLTARMLLNGYWLTQDPSPIATVNACLSADLKAKGKGSRFFLTPSGYFGLKPKEASTAPPSTPPIRVQSPPRRDSAPPLASKPLPRPEPKPEPVPESKANEGRATPVRRPSKLRRPEIVMALGTVEESLALLTAEVVTWKRPRRSLFSFRRPAPRVPGDVERVFWVERDPQILDTIFDESGPSRDYYEQILVQERFEEALQEFLAPERWWLLQPIQVHPAWESAIGAQLERLFPAWETSPGRYAAEWPAGEAWHRRFALNKHP